MRDSRICRACFHRPSIEQFRRRYRHRSGRMWECRICDAGRERASNSAQNNPGPRCYSGVQLPSACGEKCETNRAIVRSRGHAVASVGSVDQFVGAWKAELDSLQKERPGSPRLLACFEALMTMYVLLAARAPDYSLMSNEDLEQLHREKFCEFLGETASR